MKIDEIDPITANDLATQYRQEGMVVIPGIDLPDSFQPPATDLVFLNVEGTCEVYVEENVNYQGSNRTWRHVNRRAPSPGRTRLALTTRGDFFSGLGRIRGLIGDAGGNYGAPQPSQVSTSPPAHQEHPGRDVESALAEDVDSPLPDDGLDNPSTEEEGGRANHTGRRSPLRNLVEEWRRTPKDYAGREDVLQALKASLVRETKPGVVLVGKEGVGKTVLVEMLARDMALDRDIPSQLRRRAIYDLPLGMIVENTRSIGEMERQLRHFLEVSGRPIFFVDELHQISRSELKPLCDLLKPALATGQIRMIGATTPIEWRKVEDNAFKRRFLEVTVEEPSPAETSTMLAERVKALSRHHQIDIGEPVIREAIMLAARYVPMRQFPDKAIDLLDLACALQTTRTVKTALGQSEEAAGDANDTEPKGDRQDENTNDGITSTTEA